MISTKVATLLAAGTLAVGLVVGAAGAIVVGEAAEPALNGAGWAGHMQAMSSMMGGPNGMMGGPNGMMGGPNGMMGGPNGMMGPSMMGPVGPGMMDLDPAAMPEWMLGHHGLATPEPSR